MHTRTHTRKCNPTVLAHNGPPPSVDPLTPCTVSVERSPTVVSGRRIKCSMLCGNVAHRVMRKAASRTVLDVHGEYGTLGWDGEAEPRRVRLRLAHGGRLAVKPRDARKAKTRIRRATPCKCGAVISDGERVVDAGRDGDHAHAGEGGDPGWEIVHVWVDEDGIVLAACLTSISVAVSQFSVCIVAPRKNRPSIG
eukprot:scaffold9592_cov118-Isochrysis_galbana.AAC.7